MNSKHIIPLQILVFIIYFIVSYIKTSNVILDSDTLEYYFAYENIENNLFPYGVEIVIPCIMYVSSILGLSFHGFLFIISLFWTPVILRITKLSISSPILVFIIIFFFSDYFFDMLVFLIRSYFSILMFFCFVLYSRTKLRYIYLMLSVFSQLSSVIFFISLSKKCYQVILSKKYNAILLLVICTFFSSGFTSFIFGNMNYSFLSSILPIDIIRKLNFYRVNYNALDGVEFLRIILLWLVGIMVILNLPRSNIECKFDSVIFCQVLLALLFSDNVVASNRFGIIAFFFYIPLFFWYMNSILKSKKIII